MELKRLERCQNDFWFYCHTREPDFYTTDKTYLIELCNLLQDFHEGLLISPETGLPYLIFIIQMPPRHGKTRTLVNFCSWVFGDNPQFKILAAAYNDDYAQDFSKFTRNIIQEERGADKDAVLFSDIFPGVQVKKDDKSVKQWSLKGSHFSFKGVGEGGGVTGKGGNLLIVDDLIKSAEEAFNQNLLNKKWLWYTSTWLSRKDKAGIGKNKNPLQIICNTPWAKNDVGGRLLEQEKGNYCLYSRPAYDEQKDKMLCEDILSYKEYKDLERIMDSVIFAANYKVERIDVKGLLYGTNWKTYTAFPKDEEGKELVGRVCAWTDTADKGKDYFCSVYTREYKGVHYVVDVLYTKDPIENTDPLTVKKIMDWQCKRMRVEENNGGRSIAINIKKTLANDHKWYGTTFSTFHQGGNKEARILSNAAQVKERIIMPANWKDLWPEFYNALTTFLKEGKNTNDDAPDTLTMIVEDSGKTQGHYFVKR